MVRIHQVLFVVSLALAVLALAPAGAMAMQGAPLAPAPMSEVPGEGSLYKADIFRDCLNFSGRLRCRTCKWVRRCDRSGCRWEEQCRWGPPVPPLPQ